MERHAKERLVGAAVLIAAAVILIPELLSGPKRPAPAAASVRSGEPPMKTYTIDLNHSPDAPATAAAVDEAAPPSEASAPQSPAAASTGAPGTAGFADQAATPAQPARAEAPKPASPPLPVPQTIPESVAVKPAAVAAAEPQRAAPVQPAQLPASPPPRPASPPVTPTSPAAAAHWAVQLGTFASKANAERLAKQWEGRGQSTVVVPLKSGGDPLYRVRVGPFVERRQADEVLRKIKPEVAGAAVVAHP